MKSTPHTSLHSLTTEEMLAYLENQLPEDKHQQVEAFLAENELYREAVDILRQQMQDEVAMQELQAREQQMEDTIQQLPLSPRIEHAPPEPKPNFLWSMLQQPVFRYGIAAVLLCTLAFFLWPRQSYENSDQLADAYLHHFEDPMRTMNKVEEDALNLYSESNYDDAIPLFQELLAEGQDPSKEIRFRMLLGVSLLQVGSLRQAEQEFDLVIQAKSTDNYQYIAGAHWYMALSLLKRG
ncbi:MAG: tetratricopeptide repeat protein, partial [Bacteroidota bacterium]